MTTAIMDETQTQEHILALTQEIDFLEGQLSELIVGRSYPNVTQEKIAQLDKQATDVNKKIVAARSKRDDLQVWMERLASERKRVQSIQRMHAYETVHVPLVPAMQFEVVRVSQRLVEAVQEVLLAVQDYDQVKQARRALMGELKRLNPADQTYWAPMDTSLLPVSNKIGASSVLNALRRMVDDFDDIDYRVIKYLLNDAGIEEEKEDF